MTETTGYEIECTAIRFAEALAVAEILVPLTKAEEMDVERIVVGHDSDNNWAFHYVFVGDATVGIESAGRGISDVYRQLERIAAES